jgi:hypothetical protein
MWFKKPVEPILMIASFTSVELVSIVPSFLNLQRIPCRHLSPGVHCKSFIHSERSIFTLRPKAITIALFLCTGIDLSRIDVNPMPDRNAWHELLKINEFRRRVGQGKPFHRMNLYFTRDQGRSHQVKSFSEFLAPFAVLI